MADSLAYALGLLVPQRTAGAVANADLLGPLTLGVEATELELAAACGLGNIDPQHGFGAGSGRAAVEAALTWPLPPQGARLVTVRPDPDALGAMAVLNLRAAGHALGEGLLVRVDLVARCDSFAHGEWRSWIAARGPLPRPASADDVAMFPEAFAAMTAVSRDPAKELGDRVAALGAWLTDGAIPAGALRSAHRFRTALAHAWNESRIRVEPADGERIALVRGAAEGTLQLGYRSAPVVIAEAAETRPRKVTVAQFAAGNVDLSAVARRLAALEPGWGGSPSIIGSPQGVGSALPLAHIAAVVSEHILPDAQSGIAGCNHGSRVFC